MQHCVEAPATMAMRALVRKSAQRHWLARVVIAVWSIHLPLVALLVPESLIGRAMDRAGSMGFLMMVMLSFIGLLALVDSVLNDWHDGPLGSSLMNHRHVGFLGLAICLVITGGGLSVSAVNGPLTVLVSFMLPASFCALVAFLDLFARRPQ